MPFRPGDKVRPVCAPQSAPITVGRVSEFVDMIQIEGEAGWGWAYNYVLVDTVPDDTGDDELTFLGLN
jgi:hypothetical protein